MPEIPLILQLRKKTHKDIALAQDIVIKELYNIFDKAIIHGGTALWRCYNGNRFSEDIDVYIPKNKKKINLLFENFQKAGFQIKKRKIGDNSLYSTLNINGTEIRFEALFLDKKPILKDYLDSEGSFISIFTLSPEDLIKEKIETYKKRLKIRDLYDIFTLLKYSNNSNVALELKKFISEFKKPLDESNLKTIIISGIIPTTEDMLNYIKNY